MVALLLVAVVSFRQPSRAPSDRLGQRSRWGAPAAAVLCHAVTPLGLVVCVIVTLGQLVALGVAALVVGLTLYWITHPHR